MKRRTRILLLIGTVAALAAPVIGNAKVDLILIRLDACFPSSVKQSNPAKPLFVSDSCSFTYQGQFLTVAGKSESLAPYLPDRRGPSPAISAKTKVTVTLKRGTTVLLSCTKEGFPLQGTAGYAPAACSSSKQVTGSIPFGTQLTCAAQAKVIDPESAYSLTVNANCWSIGSRLL